MSLYLTVSPQAMYRINRGHNKKFIPVQPRIDAYKFSFYPRVLLLWNTLPSNIVDAKTFEEFQDHVHKLYNIN